MTLDLTGARAAITAIFQTRTVTVRRDGAALTESCGLSPTGGRVEEGGDRIQMRGDYTLTLPAATTLELKVDERVTVSGVTGKTFRVVYAPPPGNLNLSRRYGLVEVR